MTRAATFLVARPAAGMSKAWAQYREHKNKGSRKNSGKIEQRTHVSGAPKIALAVPALVREEEITGTDEGGIPDATGLKLATGVKLRNQDGSDGAEAGGGESGGGCAGAGAGEGPSGGSSAAATAGNSGGDEFQV